MSIGQSAVWCPETRALMKKQHSIINLTRTRHIKVVVLLAVMVLFPIIGLSLSFVDLFSFIVTMVVISVSTVYVNQRKSESVEKILQIRRNLDISLLNSCLILTFIYSYTYGLKNYYYLSSMTYSNPLLFHTPNNHPNKFLLDILTAYNRIGSHHLYNGRKVITAKKSDHNIYCPVLNSQDFVNKYNYNWCSNDFATNKKFTFTVLNTTSSPLYLFSFLMTWIIYASYLSIQNTTISLEQETFLTNYYSKHKLDYRAINSKLLNVLVSTIII